MEHIQEELEAMEMDDAYNFNDTDLEKRKHVIFKLGQVLAHIYQVDHAQVGGKAVWEKLLSRQRKRAIVSCFRMTPLYNTPRHKVINTWIHCYRDLWLKTEEIDFASLLIGELSNPNFVPEENQEPDSKYSCYISDYNTILFHFLNFATSFRVGCFMLSCKPVAFKNSSYEIFPGIFGLTCASIRSATLASFLIFKATQRLMRSDLFINPDSVESTAIENFSFCTTSDKKYILYFD